MSKTKSLFRPSVTLFLLWWVSLRCVSGGSVEKVLILSDIHYDSLYDSSLSPTCKCNSQYDTDGTCTTGSWQDLNGQFGCDSPWALVESAISNAAKLVPDPNFILFLGDYVRHDPSSVQVALDGIKKVTEAIDYYFNDVEAESSSSSSSYKEIRLLESTFGNTDMHPDYSLETDDESATDYFKHISRIWDKTGDQLTSEMNATVQIGGYYFMEVTPGLYVISINTVIYSPSKLPNDDDGVSENEHYDDHQSNKLNDPFNQFAWLEATLAYIRGLGGKAWIIGHIPPTVTTNSYTMVWKDKFISQYTELITAYTDIVKAQFFGHTHKDEFRVLTTSSSSKSGVEWLDSGSSPLFMVGSISPVMYNNPSFREVWYDSETFEVK
jgi:sphingomyelin phosphodiesterase acid-like 3